MKQGLLTILMGLIIFLSACSEDVINMQKANDFNASKSKTGYISMQEAKARLSAIITEINSQISDPVNRYPEISSNNQLSGIALNAKMRPLTRGDDETEAGCYVFRLENDMFAIMSANASAPELLAIGKGYPNFEDSTANLPNPEYWKPVLPVDTILVNESNDTIISRIIDTKYSVVKENICPVKWGNKHPFNSQLNWIVKGYNPSDGSPILVRPAAGCVAVSLAQIMTAEELRGAYYKDHFYDWDMLSQFKFASDFAGNAEATNQIGLLFKDLLDPENLHVSQWGENVTWVYSYSVDRTLENFHFKKTGKYTGYDFDSVKNDLDNNYPVIFDATGGKDSIPEELGGHMWVCHGLLKATYTIEYYVMNKNSSNAPTYLYTATKDSWYLQMNWGWDARADGFYLAKFDDFLNNIKGPDIVEDESYPTTGYNIYQPNSTWIRYGIRFK